MFEKILNYLSNYKWYVISTIILTNVATQLSKLFIYRNLTEYIITINTLLDSDSLFISFFVKLFAINLLHELIKFFLGKIIAISINDLFNKITKCVLYNTMDFYTKDIYTKISQIWVYLNNIEFLMDKLLIEFPKILTFMGYYIYTIYSLYPQAILFIVPTNLFITIALHSLSKKQYKLQRKRTKLDMDVKNKLLEAITNIEFIKLNSHEQQENNRINGSFEYYTKNKIYDKWINFCIDFLSNVYNDFILLVIYSIGIIYIIEKSIRPIDLLYLAVNTGNFYYQIVQLKDIYNYYMRINPKLEVIYDILNSKVEEIEATKIINHTASELNNKNIIYKNITFSYNKVINVINNLSFEFIGNKINLLLGPNGSGKSTLIKLLLRLYDVEDDRIYFKGCDINSMSLKELRDKICFVSYEPCIFNESVLYNIKYGNENISDNKIMELCDIIYSRNWLLQNKNKDTGFRGKNLSGGEKKKIQLINAICKDSEVIIFDEPTNTLDSTALKWFNEFIKLLRDDYNKTVIIITHDLRLKDVCDNIVDLSKINQN